MTVDHGYRDKYHAYRRVEYKWRKMSEQTRCVCGHEILGPRKRRLIRSLTAVFRGPWRLLHRRIVKKSWARRLLYEDVPLCGDPENDLRRTKWSRSTIHEENQVESRHVDSRTRSESRWLSESPSRGSMSSDCAIQCTLSPRTCRSAVFASRTDAPSSTWSIRTRGSICRVRVSWWVAIVARRFKIVLILDILRSNLWRMSLAESGADS